MAAILGANLVETEIILSVRNAAIWQASVRYFSFIIQFISTVIISRWFLAPDEVGLFSIAMAIALIVAMIQDFGIPRYIMALHDLTGDQLEKCASISIYFTLIIFIIMVILASPLASYYEQPRLFSIFLIIAASFLFTPFSVISESVAMYDLDFKTIFVIQGSSAIAMAIVNILLAWLGYSSESLAWGVFAAAITKAAVSCILRPIRWPWPLRLSGTRQVVTFGSQSLTLNFIGAIGWRALDIVIGALLSLTAVGLFSRANAMPAQLYSVLSGAIGGVLYPAFARKRDRGEALGADWLHLAGMFTALNWAALLALALLAEPVTLLLYGELWAGVAGLLFWLCLSELFDAALPLKTELPILLGKIDRLIWVNLIDTILSIGLLIYFAQWGIEWVAISRIFYRILWYLLYGVWLWRLLNFSLFDLGSVYLQSGFAALVAIIPIGVWHLWVKPLAQIGFIDLLLIAICGILFWLSALFIVRHPARAEILLVKDIMLKRFMPR